MHNPRFAPDIFIRTSVVNFSVSSDGVEALMLAHIARLELRDLDALRAHFLRTHLLELEDVRSH